MNPPTRGVPIPHTRTWADPSSHSLVTVCALCNLSRAYPARGAQQAAQDASLHHRSTHPEVKGWTLAEADRLSPCTADQDCTAPRLAKGLCRKHYQRDYREWKAEQIQETNEVAA